MSSDNAIVINRNNFRVNYCLGDYSEFIGQGKTLDEAIDIAQKKVDDCGGMVEYGITFIGKGKKVKLVDNPLVTEGYNKP